MRLDLVQNFHGCLRILLCLLGGTAWIAPAQQAKEETSELVVLRAEVKRLAQQLLQHRAEFIQWKMHWIRAELEQVKSERQRLASERQSIEREIGELNLASTNGPGAEDEARREELKTVQVPALLAGERAATAREAALIAVLNTENTQMAEIQKQMQGGGLELHK
jgi:hypothetical protein